jgi:hypothetical protein
MAKYTWIVARDRVSGDNRDAVGQIGPPGAKNRASFEAVVRRGAHFRLLDSRGEVRYTGYILGEYQGSEPLEEYGRWNGCTQIQYQSDGVWKAS